LLPAARMLPPGNSLTEGYDEFLTVPSTPRATSVVLPAPAPGPVAVPTPTSSASPTPHLASTGSGLSQPVPLPSHAPPSGPARPLLIPTSQGVRHPVHPVLPDPVPLAGAPSVSASNPPETASAPPAKRAKRATRSSAFMSKAEVPHDYIRVRFWSLFLWPRFAKLSCAVQALS
jgi:hypothetical protein